jgi:hypothetical protein
MKILHSLSLGSLPFLVAIYFFSASSYGSSTKYGFCSAIVGSTAGNFVITTRVWEVEASTPSFVVEQDFRRYVRANDLPKGSRELASTVTCYTEFDDREEAGEQLGSTIRATGLGYRSIVSSFEP